MVVKYLTALLFAIATATAPSALAQAWPTQPIKVIVGFPPGGVADAILDRMTVIARRANIKLD